jgi:hypothetical protein
MTDVPTGRTGEKCKEDGTYACECGEKRYYGRDECFGRCPQTGKVSFWRRVT